MKELGSCVPPISGEHLITESVAQVLMAGGEFSLSGVPWLEEGEEKILPPPTANCLCVKHNSALHPLDDAARYFFASLKSYLEQDAGLRHAIASGHDIERWLLKTAKAVAVSKNLAKGREPLSGVFARDAAILDMLDNPGHWPDGAGLYCVMNTGEMTQNQPRFQLQPFTNDQGEIEVLGFNILARLPLRPDPRSSGRSQISLFARSEVSTWPDRNLVSRLNQLGHDELGGREGTRDLDGQVRAAGAVSRECLSAAHERAMPRVDNLSGGRQHPQN